MCESKDGLAASVRCTESRSFTKRVYNLGLTWGTEDTAAVRKEEHAD